VFGKELGQLDRGDIEKLVSEEYQENQTLELKSMLPAETGKTDPWHEGKKKIGDYAKRKLLDEIVAFANGYGGWMFLGIVESDGQPKRAVGVEALRDCSEVANRFRQICRDAIEPQLPVIQIEGIVTEDDGSGIVGFYVPRSRLAPHRNQMNRECCIRKADRCEKMTMRDIQELTIQSLRRGDDIEQYFRKRSEQASLSFRDFRDAVATVATGAFQLRVSAFPTESIRLERVHGRIELQQNLKFPCENEHGHETEAFILHPCEFWRPVLRGTRGTYRRNEQWLQVELGDEGRVDYSWAGRDYNGNLMLYSEWFLGLLWNSLAQIQRLRHLADAPGVEYAIEVALDVYGQKLLVPHVDQFLDHVGSFSEGVHSFLKHSVGPIDEFDLVSKSIQQDFCDVAGIDPANIYRTGFQPALR